MRKSLVGMKDLVRAVVAERVEIRSGKEREKRLAKEMDERKSKERQALERAASDRRAENAVVVYFDNFGKHYRAIIVGVDSLVYRPREARVELPKNVGDGVYPVFLTKKARKDVEHAVTRRGGRPSDYITPASQSWKGDLNQGVVYTIESMFVKKNVYYDFVKRNVDQLAGSIDEYMKEIDGNEDAPRYDCCTCDACPHVIRGIGEFSCRRLVFKKPKDMKFIKTKVYCDQFQKGIDPAKVVFDGQD